ncbi:hypothetical protein FHR87_001468 [Azomonas macrocytogenes]|uniref:Transposase n=1 Tax=Azomonas macrocytogenes TaxID=69962 RepID=A0A839T5W4_AZOMA|nr:hypothetical protein [Azomonas macrocytogenes]
MRELIRVADKRHVQPSTVILDNHTQQSTPESGARTGYDGTKRRKGSKVHMAVCSWRLGMFSRRGYRKHWHAMKQRLDSL